MRLLAGRHESNSQLMLPVGTGLESDPTHQLKRNLVGDQTSNRDLAPKGGLSTPHSIEDKYHELW